MDECAYFTRRTINEGKGRIMAWVFRGSCPKCRKALMGKPRNDTGGVKIRSLEYVCPACSHTVEKKAYEDTLTCNIQYTCPYCKKSGEAQAPFQRRTFEGAKAVVFECGSCKKKLGVTKKMKVGKGSPIEDDDD